MKLSRLTQISFVLLFFVIVHIASTTGVQSSLGRNDNSSCGGCHGSGTSGIMTYTGLPSTVAASTTYSVQICINDNTKVAGGFRLHISQGTYSNLGAGVREGGTGVNLGLTHDSPKTIILGQVCWDFDWTSPASAGTVNLQLYGNAVNLTGNTGGDNGGYQAFDVITVMAAPPCTADLVITDNPIPTDTYEASNSITANTPLATSAVVTFEAPTEINLNADFEVPLGADFETLTGVGQGCLTAPNPSSIETGDDSEK